MKSPLFRGVTCLLWGSHVSRSVTCFAWGHMILVESLIFNKTVPTKCISFGVFLQQCRHSMETWGVIGPTQASRHSMETWSVIGPTGLASEAM